MKHATTIAALAAVLSISAGLPAPAPAQTRITVQDVEEICTRRTRRFAQDAVGPNGRERRPFEIRAAYIRCFHGYTGRDPGRIPNIPTR